jgi:hypothetical protein
VTSLSCTRDRAAASTTLGSLSDRAFRSLGMDPLEFISPSAAAAAARTSAFSSSSALSASAAALGSRMIRPSTRTALARLSTLLSVAAFCRIPHAFKVSVSADQSELPASMIAANVFNLRVLMCFSVCSVRLASFFIWGIATANASSSRLRALLQRAFRSRRCLQYRAVCFGQSVRALRSRDETRDCAGTGPAFPAPLSRRTGRFERHRVDPDLGSQRHVMTEPESGGPIAPNHKRFPRS